MEQIIVLTTKIETDHPELYKYLDETPITGSDVKASNLGIKELEAYLSSLMEQLKNHINTHQRS